MINKRGVVFVLVFLIVVFTVSAITSSDTDEVLITNETIGDFIKTINDSYINESISNEGLGSLDEVTISPVNESYLINAATLDESPITEPLAYLNQTVIQETEIDIITKLKRLVAKRINELIGNVVSIEAILTYENQTPIPSVTFEAYRNDTLFATGMTDSSGHISFEWDTELEIPSEYLVNISYPGQRTVLGQQTITMLPSHDYIFVKLSLNNSAPVLNFIPDITVTKPKLVKIKAIATDADNDSLSYSIDDSRFSKDTNIFTWQTSDNDVGVYTVKISVSDGKDSTSQNVKVTVVEKKSTKEITIKNKAGNYYLISKDSAWTILKKDYIDEYLDYKFIYLNESYYKVYWKWNDGYVRGVLTACTENDIYDKDKCIEDIAILSNKFLVNYSITNFVKTYFPNKEFSELASDMNFLKQNSMPKMVVKGNAEIIGDIDVLNNDNSSFYIELKDGFYNSNGLRIKLGLNSTLAEFNNSKTSEVLTFTGNENIMRYLKIPKDSNVASATLNVKSYPHVNFTYVPNQKSFNMTSGCNGEIKLSPTASYNFQVCLASSGQTFTDSCKTYTSGNFSSGDKFKTETFPGNLLIEGINNYKMSFHWKRIKDASGKYDYGGSCGDTANSACLGTSGPDPGRLRSRVSGCGSYTSPQWNEITYLCDSSGCSNSACNNPPGTYVYEAYGAGSCRCSDGWTRTGGSQASLGGCTANTNGADAEGGPYAGCHAADANKYWWTTCSPGTPADCQTNLCTYAGDNTDTSSYFVYNSSLASANTNFQNKITSYGTVSWNADYRLTNPYLEIGTVDTIYEWNHLGEFNTSETTSDLSSAINVALNNGACDCNGCSLNGDNCIIPFLFHSDTEGFLEYSSINITYYNYPKNPTLDAGNDSDIEWNHSGTLNTTETTPDFRVALQKYLDNETLCPQSNSTCNIPLVFFSNSSGILEISNINIQYMDEADTSPPAIYNITVTPNPTNPGTNLYVKVNATDNQALNSVNATITNLNTTLSYNSTSKLYEGYLTAPGPGEYALYITAKDLTNLTTTNSTLLTVTETNAELMVYSQNITYFPANPKEGDLVIVNAKIFNYGNTNANNFNVELFIDGVSEVNNTVSVAAISNNLTQFNWTTTYGNHTLTIKADSNDIISEANESNNNISKSVFIADNTPPIVNKIITNSVSEGDTLSIMVNATDNVGINGVIATFNWGDLTLTYNSTSRLYESSTTAPVAGNYALKIIVTDTTGLLNLKQETVIVNPNQADLKLIPGEVFFSSALKDGYNVEISSIIHNQGGTDTENFTTEFFIDGISQINNSPLSVSANGNITTQFTWSAVYGNHSLSIKIDSLNNITEANETNNNLTISINVLDTTLPVINEVILPDVIYENLSFNIKANATDNFGVSSVNATLDDSNVNLIYNSTSTLYENSFIAPTSSQYNLTIIAEDVNDLTSSINSLIRVYASEADLNLDFTDIILSPDNISENSTLTINTTVHNNGGTDANNFQVELFIDGGSEGVNTISVTRGLIEVTQFSWNATYGYHNLTIKADKTNNITESNETNNNHTKAFFVADNTPPPALTPTANPAGWTNITIFNISWQGVTDTNGIAKYEYQIDYGDWTSIADSTSFITPTQSNGAHTVYVRAVDVPGNAGTPGNISIFIDTTAPNTPFIREWHCGDGWTQHSTPYFTWTDPGDIGSGIHYYMASIDSGAAINLSNNRSYHPNWTTGNHTFKIYAVDAIGHQSDWSNAVTVYIDTEEPTAPVIISPTHPINDLWYSISMPVFNWTEPEDGSGILGYYYILDKVVNTTPTIMAQWTENTTLNITGVGDMQANSSNKTGLFDGTWYLHIISKDNAGNVGENTTHYKIKIDTTAPVVINLTPSNNSDISDTTPSIIANYLDISSGINTSKVTLYLNGLSVFATVNETAVTYTSSPLTYGLHTLSLYTQDNVQNFRNISWSFTVTATSFGNTSVLGYGGKKLIGASYNTTFTLTQQPTVKLVGTNYNTTLGWSFYTK